MKLNHPFIYIFSSFLAGFSIMTVELISSRILAPLIGNSVYTWTSIIGVILLGLSIGGWLGGKIADKDKNNPKVLSLVFSVSAVLVFFISPLASHSPLIGLSNSILLLNLVFSFYLFFLPALTIGMIQPLILKIYTSELSTLGKKYGLLSAFWSLGGILGVFLTGFYFISHFGSKQTLWMVSAVLFLASLFISFSHRKIILILLFIFSASILFGEKSNPSIIFKKETNYYQAKVLDKNLSTYGKSRILFLDLDVHSIEPSEKNENFYPEIYPVFEYLKNDLKKILVIGAGAYTLPKYFAKHYPEAEVEVIEVDPELEKIAEEYFNLEESRIKTTSGDARVILQKNLVKYDLIFGDAYNSFISVPWYLLTTEWNEKIKENLNEGGMYAINFISALDEERSDFTKAVLKTFSLTFPNFYVFNFGSNPHEVQNITVIGINGNLPLSETEFLEKIQEGENTFLKNHLISLPLGFQDGTILSDNFAPVEKLMSPIIKSYFPQSLIQVRKILEP